VARLGEFSPIGRFVSFGSFLNYGSRQKFLATFFHGRSYEFILSKKWVWLHFGLFHASHLFTLRRRHVKKCFRRFQSVADFQDRFSGFSGCFADFQDDDGSAADTAPTHAQVIPGMAPEDRVEMGPTPAKRPSNIPGLGAIFKSYDA
jgi:hypothetical protein